MTYLTDVCDFQGGTQPPKSSWSKTPQIGYVRMLQIRDFTQQKSSFVEYVKDAATLKKCNSDDVLIGRYGASIGKILTGHSGAYNVAIVKTIPNEKKISKEFLYYLLIGNDFQNFIKNIGSRAAQAGFNKNELQKFEFYLPSLVDQEQIVKRLRKADLLRQKRKESIKLLDEYLNSMFLYLFGDMSSNPKGWDIGQISDLVSEVKYGTSAKAGVNGKFPYLRMNNITYSGELDLSNLKYLDLKKNEEEKYLVKKGDILFNRTNSKELVGKTAVYNLDEPMAIAGYLIRVRTNNKALPEYIAGYLNSKHGKKILENMCKSIIGMANINAQELQKIKIMIPPTNLQAKYRDILLRKQSLKQKMIKQSEELNSQFQSLMQRSFASS